MISVTIPGPPRPQGRGRAFRVGAGIRVYDPPASRSWKGAAQVHMLKACPAPLDGPLVVLMLAVFACPASDYLKRGIRPRRWHTKANADVENLEKALLDAGNGILWHDDRQVAVLHGAKIIGAQGEPPGVQVTVSALPDEEPASSWTTADHRDRMREAWRESIEKACNVMESIQLAREAR
jgi:Holliday junction resolvase RusA-like endonuclease